MNSPLSLRALAGWAVALALIVSSGAPATAASPKKAPQLEGYWAQLHYLTELNEIPMVGEVTMTTKFLVVSKLVPKGKNKYESREALCAMDTETSHPIVGTIFNKGWITAMSGAKRPAEVSWNAAKKRWEYGSAGKKWVRGARLKDPEHDPLPTSVRDRRLIDEDGDGKPGLTIGIRGVATGNVQLVLRVWNDFRGIVRSDDAVDGIITWGREQEAISASNLFLRSLPDSNPHPDKAKSFFRLRRVDRSWTCDKLLKEWKQLFKDVRPPAPPPKKG